ncbi:DUF6075 family protein [Clostridium estertheticum]|uniref:DUF6075 family protein n=1 Tax=Clostridium estertheticum TaxID=238834 RepID=UPI0013E94CD3|nr:DUF6075 family protein [Clostridium estertheticum]MBZ9684983.1 DUF6075 family protein [Clostridium estertheticum]
MNIRFKDTEHEQSFLEFIASDNVEVNDVERLSLFYLLALNKDTRRSINSLYNFEGRHIEPEALDRGWQTSSSRKVTKLAFNLFNNFNDREYDDFSPLELFSTSDALYMSEALKIRLRDYFGEI